MLFLACGFLLGMLSLLVVEDTFQALFVLVTSLFCVFFVVFKQHSNRMLIGLICGLIWSSANVIFYLEYSRSFIENPINAKITGFICSIPVQRDNNIRFDLCVTQLNNDSIPWFKFNRVNVNWGKYAVRPTQIPQAGEFWRFAAKLRPVHGKVNPNAFDSERWSLSEGVAATASIKQYAAIQDSSPFSLQAKYQQKRQLIYNHLLKVLPQDSNQGLMLAILLGERGLVSQQQWQVFQQSGTSHLLAISGLHVGIAAIWCYWIVLILWKSSANLCRWLPAPKVAEVASLFGALSLVLLSGLGLPAQRALLMLLIFLVSRWSGRSFSFASIISLSMLLILLIQPFAVLSVSFWLSFIAVCIIALVINRQPANTSKLVSWFSINWYLYLLLLPVSWLFFGMLSWTSLFANLLLIPYYSFILTPLLYLSAAISSVSVSAASTLLEWSSQLFELSLQIQATLAQWNQLFESLPLSALLCVFMLMLLVTLLLPKKLLSRAVLLPIGGILLAIGLYPATSKTRVSGWIFDVGHGLVVYLQTPEGNLLFDTGWGNQEFATLTTSVLPFMQANKIESLDKVVISHADADHAGGLSALTKNIQIKQILAGEELSVDNEIDCHQFKPWTWSQVTFKLLKHANAGAKGNNASCVLEVTVANKKILLTGDIEKSAEKRLNAQLIGEYWLVVAPHHGSLTSSTSQFVGAVKPENVVFSTGYNNQWNFPRDEVVQRYRDLDSHIFNTANDGAINFSVSHNNEFAIGSLRQQQSNFWSLTTHKD